MNFSTKDIAEYIVMLIAAFARRYSLSDAEAYSYLNRYGVIKWAHGFYDVMHTLSFDDMVDGTAAYCRRKGGLL